MSVVNAKPFHPRPDDLRHEREDKFSHAAQGRFGGPAEVSTSAFGVKASFDRKAVLAWVKHRPRNSQVVTTTEMSNPIRHRDEEATVSRFQTFRR